MCSIDRIYFLAINSKSVLSIEQHFLLKNCKYDVFCPEIRKNALIDSFLRIAAVIDSSASSAGLVVPLVNSSLRRP